MSQLLSFLATDFVHHFLTLGQLAGSADEDVRAPESTNHYFESTKAGTLVRSTGGQKGVTVRKFINIHKMRFCVSRIRFLPVGFGCKRDIGLKGYSGKFGQINIVTKPNANIHNQFRIHLEKLAIWLE